MMFTVGRLVGVMVGFYCFGSERKVRDWTAVRELIFV